MRVMHIITDLRLGGAERMLTRIAPSNVENGEPSSIVVSLTDGGPCAAILREAGVEVISLGMRRTIPNPADLFRLVKIVRSQKPDLVMTWLYHADLCGTLVALLAGIRPGRIIWNIRTSKIDFSRNAKSTHYIVRLLSLLSRIPGAVATNSYAGRVAHMDLGYRPRQWVYLPNGFDLDEWRPDATERATVRAGLEVPDNSVLIGMVARVDPAKDYQSFLAAAEQTSQVRDDLYFLLIGAGTDRLSIPSALARRVIALGTRHDIQRMMRAMDIHVLSSTNEGFPNVVGEAMASEVPCIVTDVGDAAALVTDTGLIVPPRDPEALAEAMLRLAGESPEQRRERGRMARASIQQRYGINIVRGIYYKLWRTIYGCGD